MNAAPAILVTGASTGIGRATVLRLARAGRIVLAGVRRADDGAALVAASGPNVRPLLLDVAERDAPARARGAIDAMPDIVLSALVNNAGIAIAGPLALLPHDELRRQFDVNFFGAIALAQALLPRLLAQRGRIVNVSSIGGKLALPFVGAYAASKFALEAASDALRVEVAGLGVRVIVVEPGAVKTPIWQRGAEAGAALLASVSAADVAPYEASIRKITALTQRMERRGTQPERVAAVIEHALFAPRPRARYLVGTDARVRLLLARLPEALRDRILAAAVAAPRVKQSERSERRV